MRIGWMSRSRMSCRRSRSTARTAPRASSGRPQLLGHRRQFSRMLQQRSGGSVRVVVWNIANKARAFEALATLESDIALLNGGLAPAGRKRHLARGDRRTRLEASTVVRIGSTSERTLRVTCQAVLLSYASPACDVLGRSAASEIGGPGRPPSPRGTSLPAGGVPGRGAIPTTTKASAALGRMRAAASARNPAPNR